VSRVYYPQCRAILQVVFDGFGDDARDTEPLILPVLPKAATVHRNAYDDPDSWELVFDADDFPVDPQLVRAGAAEVYLFQTSGLADPNLMDRQFSELDAPTSGRKRTPLEELGLEVGLQNSKDRFTWGTAPTVAGLFDDLTANYDSGGRWVTISGQDYTAYLDGRQWPPTDGGKPRRIPTGKRLDKFVEEILAMADPDDRLTVSVENLEPSSLPRVGQNETRGKRRGIPVEQDTTYWDVISKTVRRHGFIAFVRGLDVVITHPKNLTDDSEQRIREMSWGQNLESLELSRHLGKKTVPSIIVQAYSDRDRAPITVEYPKGAWQKVKQSSRKLKRGGESTSIKKTNEYEIVPVYGVTDRAVLRQMAKARYDRLGREEREVIFRTRDLKDLEDRDLLDLAAGDALRLNFSEFSRDHALLSDDKVSAPEKVSHLLARGFTHAAAEVIANHYTELRGLTRPLRVSEITYEYDSETGISIEGRLLDFIVVDGLRDPNAKTPRKNQEKRRKKDGTIAGAKTANHLEGTRR